VSALIGYVLVGICYLALGGLIVASLYLSLEVVVNEHRRAVRLLGRFCQIGWLLVIAAFMGWYGR
jgi:hypothetical protein